MTAQVDKVQAKPAAKPVFTVLLLLVLVVHIGAMFLWIAPSNALSKALSKPLTQYALPWFQQSWSLFAPNPIDAAYYLEVRAVPEGLSETEWVSASDVELSALHHNPLPPTATNVSNKLATGLHDSLQPLQETEREVLGWNFHHDVWTRIPQEIEKAGASPSPSLQHSLDLDQAITAYATQFLKAQGLIEDTDLVQYRISKYSVRAFDVRETTDNSEQIVFVSGRRSQEVLPHQDEQGFRKVLEALGS